MFDTPVAYSGWSVMGPISFHIVNADERGAPFETTSIDVGSTSIIGITNLPIF